MQRAIKWFLGLLASTAFLCGGFVVLHGSLPPASINAWLPAGSLTAARTGSASVLLQDGRLFITGGNGASGALATTDILDPSSGFTPGPPMSIARSSHVAVVLVDGRVLVAGGTDASGRASQSAELFDPAANSWSASGPLMVGRSGATATLLPSGQVLIAGGTANGTALASLELFDPNSNTFSLVAGTLSSPRENHAAALLPDGRVLVAGGWDGTTVAPVPPASTGTANVLASSDIFDPATGTVAPGPALAAPRMNFTATTALDGSIVAIGGTDGQNDLASIAVLVPGAGTFALSGAQLTTARQGHLAFLLPHNGNILVVGGISSGVAVSSAEIYTPWTGATSVTGVMASARSGATGSPLFQTILGAPVGLDGALIVAGGLDASSPPAALASAEVYGFATVKTDKADYSPGETAYFSGSGWLPNETVQMSLVEVPDLDGDSPIALTATADANGNFSNVTFPINAADLNVHFTLTAVGSASQAQTTFTDALGTSTALTSSANPSNAGDSVTFTATVTESGTGGGTSGTLVTSGSVAFGTGTNCAVGGFTAFTGSPVTLNGSGQASLSHTFTTATGSPFTVRACYSGAGSGSTAFSTSSTSLSQTVNAAAAVTHFLVTPSTTTPTAGTPFSVTVTAQDASNATVTSYTGTVHFSLTNTDAGATLPANYTFTGGDAGVHTFTNGVTLTVAGAQTINATDTVTSSITGSANLTVGAGTAAKVLVETKADGTGVVVPAQSVTSGSTVTGYAITRDSSNNFVANAVATWSLTNIGGGVVAGDLVAAGDNKSATFTGHLLGSANMHAAIGALTPTESGLLTVMTGTASKLAFTTTAQTLVVGQCSTPITVQSQDSGGNPSNPASNVQVNLSIFSGGTGGFFSESTCTTSAPSVMILSTGNTASFYFKGTSVGSPTTIQATDNASVLALAKQDETVNKANTTTNVTRTAGTEPSVYGQLLTFQAAVAVNSPGSGTPDGNVNFYDAASGATCALLGASTQIGATQALSSGLASVSTSALPVAGSPHNILACYLGSTNFNDSGGSLSGGQTVTPKALTALGTLSVSATKVYDGTTAATMSGAAALLGSEAFGSGTSSDGKPYTGDAVTLTSTVPSSATYNTKDVATATTVTFNGLSLTGAVSGNYTLTDPTQAATITAKALTITGLTASARVYDGTTVEPLGGTAALLAAETAGTGSTGDGKPYLVDSVSAGGTAVGAFADKNVGTAKPVTVTGVTITGTGSGNYTATQPTGLTADITTKAITATLTAADKTYDGNINEPNASMSCSFTGVLPADSLNVTCTATSGTFNTSQVPTANLVTATVTMSGSESGNYTLGAAGTSVASTSATATAHITPVHLTVTADNQTKIYNGAVFSPFTATISGFVNGENSSVVSGAPAFSGSAVAAVNPGTYTITPAQGTLSAANYDFPPANFINGTLTITYGVCSAGNGPGGVILPPINSDGTSVYNRKGGSTIPVKFTVCDASGNPISNPAAVFAGTLGSITLLGAVRGTVDGVNENSSTDIPDVAFRFTGSQWIFNMATTNLTPGSTDMFRINLAYGNIIFTVGVK